MSDSGSSTGRRRGSPHALARTAAWRARAFERDVRASLGEIQNALHYVHHATRAEHVQRQRHATTRRATTQVPIPAPPDIRIRQKPEEPHFVPDTEVPGPPAFVLLTRPKSDDDKPKPPAWKLKDNRWEDQERPAEPLPLPELATAKRIVRQVRDEGFATAREGVEHASAAVERLDPSNRLNDADRAARKKRALAVADQKAFAERARTAAISQHQEAVSVELVRERAVQVHTRTTRVLQQQIAAEDTAMVLESHARYIALASDVASASARAGTLGVDAAAALLRVSGLTVTRLSALGLDTVQLGQLLVAPGASSAEMALKLVCACTAMPKWAGRVVTAIGAAGLLGVAIPIPPVAAAAGVTAGTFLLAGLLLNVACYLVESPFHAVSSTFRLVQAGLSLAETGARITSSLGQLAAVPLHTSSFLVRYAGRAALMPAYTGAATVGVAASLLKFGANASYKVAKSSALTSRLVDVAEESVTRRTAEVVRLALLPTIDVAESSLELMKARLMLEQVSVPSVSVEVAEVRCEKAELEASLLDVEAARVSFDKMDIADEAAYLAAKSALRIARQRLAARMVTYYGENQYDLDSDDVVDVAGVCNALTQDPGAVADFATYVGSHHAEEE